MTQVRTNGPRISPGWLAGLLAAEAHCEWASWFRVRHEDWEQRPMPGLSGLEWSVDYTQRLNRCIKLYEDQGYTVSNGGPNGYVLSVGGAALSGRPDVIATKGGDCIVIDFPEGEPTRSHALQVMIHMYALSMAVERFRGMALSGQLAYGRESVDILAASVDREFIENMTELARRLAAGEPPARIPSPEECGACDITAADCPERMDEGGTGRFRFPDPPDSEDYFDMLERAEWAEADRDREHEARTRAVARIKELEEEIRQLSSL